MEMKQLFGFSSASMQEKFGGSIYTTPNGGQVHIYQVTDSLRTQDEVEGFLKRSSIPDLKFVGPVVRWVGCFGKRDEELRGVIKPISKLESVFQKHFEETEVSFADQFKIKEPLKENIKLMLDAAELEKFKITMKDFIVNDTNPDEPDQPIVVQG